MKAARESILKRLLLSGVLAMLVSACGTASKGANDPAAGVLARTWFDSPLPGSSYASSATECQIVAHASSPDGIAAFELSINGAATVLASEDTKSTLTTLRQDCGFSEAGDYVVRLRAQENNGQWSGYAETRVTIVGETTGSTPVSGGGIGPGGGIIVESVSTDHIFAGSSDCGPTEVKIVARASAPAGIEVVVLFYRFEPGGGAAYKNVVMQPSADDLYEATLNMRSILGRSVPFDLAKLNYQIVIQQKNGDTSLRTPVMKDVEVQACGNTTLSCSGYNSQPTCEAHGCKWVLLPGILPVFKCGNP